MSTITDLLSHRLLSSRELQALTKQNQTAVSRQLRALGDQVVRIPQGRTVKYALAKAAFGGGHALPLLQVDAQGQVRELAKLRPLAHGGYFVESSGAAPRALLGDQGNGLYDDLPYFLYDQCPQGFLGRQIAKRLAERTGEFPSDPRRWTSDQIGTYLVSNSQALQGNLRLGSLGLYRVSEDVSRHSQSEYPELAQNVLYGAVPGSSAGGEQPKFAVFNQDLQAHVIVKFTPKGDGPLVQRWRDILVSEHVANEALSAIGVAAAETRLLEAGGRLFLESKRFDRVGEKGCRAMLSLACVDAEFTGLGGSWVEVAEALCQKQLLSEADLEAIKHLWWFGAMIHNTDRHLGNVSLTFDEEGFSLLPIYDMCSMGFAPISGEVLPYQESPFFAHKAKVFDASSMALSRSSEKALRHAMGEFWHAMQMHEKTSDELKAVLSWWGGAA